MNRKQLRFFLFLGSLVCVLPGMQSFAGDLQKPLQAKVLQNKISALVNPPAGSKQVEIKVDAPTGVSGYTALHPVTFGVLFKQNEMLNTHVVRLVNAAGTVQQAQYEINKLWNGTSYVKWLHVDAIIQVTNGTPDQLFLQYGPTVPTPPGNTVKKPIAVTFSGGTYTINTKSRTFTISPTASSIGKFTLTKDVGGVLTDYLSTNSNAVVTVEKQGPVRTTILVTGNYTSSGGVQASKFQTRYRFYSQSSWVKIDHTLLWTENDGSKINALKFTPTNVGSSPTMKYGLDGTVTTSTSFDLKQTSHNQVKDASGTVVGQKLDGWMEIKNSTRNVYMSLRWPWQQYPTRIAAPTTATSALYLIGPENSLGLTGQDQAIDPLKNYVDSAFDIPNNYGPFNKPPSGLGPVMSPLGVGKSYEIMYWDSNSSADPGRDLAPATKNTLLQHPVYAYADPAFTVQAELPSPMSAVDATSFPEVEAALSNSFDWVTREDPAEYDYGIWNFGDIQYDWHELYASGLHGVSYRYWMNNGKGWSVVPWMLWMRSGSRKYIENAEAHARHVMDVDTCHLTNVTEHKYSGGTYSYAPLHWGFEATPVHFVNDSEYLIYSYHLLGYERARDVLNERVEGILATFTNNIYIGDIQDMVDFLAVPYNFGGGVTAEANTKFNREMYKALGEFAVMFEETGDSRLYSRAEELWNFLSVSQATNGWIPGLKLNIWTDYSLNAAARAMPGYTTAIKTLLHNWADHLGMYTKPSASGQVLGPLSLWTMYTLESFTGDSRYLDALVGYAKTEALSVNSDASPFRGLSKRPIPEMGGAMRDMMASLAKLSQIAPGSRPAGVAPMSYFNGNLPRNTFGGTQYAGRSVVYVLDETDQAFDVTLDFFGFNAGYALNQLIRIYAPDGAESTTTNVFDNAPSELASFPYSTAPNNPYTVEGLSQYHNQTVLHFAQDGKSGAYAIEIYTPGLDIPVSARSTLGKVVHYIPDFAKRSEYLTPYKLYYNYYAEAGSVTTGAGSGQAWFMPDPNDQQVEFGFFKYALYNWTQPDYTLPPYSTFVYFYRDDWPSLRIQNALGTEKCHTTITGISADGLTNPVGVPCTFTQTDPNEMLSLVTQNQNWHYKLNVKGAKPFFSATQGEWFDPAAYQHVAETTFLVPRD